MRASDKWLSESQDVGTETHARNTKKEQLEDALFLWFTDIHSRRCVVNDDVIIKKAKQLGKRLDVPADFCYSRG